LVEQAIPTLGARGCVRIGFFMLSLAEFIPEASEELIGTFSSICIGKISHESEMCRIIIID